MKSVTCIVCARIMITWLKRWKVARRTHVWWKAWENQKSMEICESTTTPVSQDSFWAKPASREAKKLNHHNNQIVSNSNGSSSRFSIQSQLDTPNQTRRVACYRVSEVPKVSKSANPPVFWMFHDLFRYFMTFLMLQQHLLEELGVAREELRNVCKVVQCSPLFDGWMI